jgi:polysaccharide biosynthesis transport protein
MAITGSLSGPAHARGPASAGGSVASPKHYLRLILHRKWLVLGTFLLVTAVTCAVTQRLPNVFTSETLILVDPQKVPESYVKSTVTGDVRNRLGTLSQQILSASRLQKVIETLNLYPAERKSMPREDVILKMRSDISVNVVSDFGGSQDLQAFRIRYSGRDPRLVAQVANELASLFIDENLKAREQQATGTTEFLQNQLQETRKVLEAQEAKLKDFKLKHIGEMPEQQTANLQILGQLQSQLQLLGESLSRAEQQKAFLQSMVNQSAPVVDMDEKDLPSAVKEFGSNAKSAGRPSVSAAQTQLGALLARGYSESHPTIKKLRAQIEVEDPKKEVLMVAPEVPMPTANERTAAPVPVVRRAPAPVSSFNPVLQSQLNTLEAEIAKHKQDQDRLSKQIRGYQGKVEAIPVREQQITELVRDYEMSKAHYSQLLDKQLSAQTATQLEIRQKGEKFAILDPAQPAERPSSPNRPLINGAGSLAGLALGVLLALITEFVGMSITSADQITESTGIPVLEVIPVIQTFADRVNQRRRIIIATASGVLLTVLASGAALFIHYRT